MGDQAEEIPVKTEMIKNVEELPKCPGCGGVIDEPEEKGRRSNSKRWWHKTCYEEQYSEDAMQKAWMSAEVKCKLCGELISYEDACKKSLKGHWYHSSCLDKC